MIRVFTDKLRQFSDLPADMVEPVDAFGGFVAVDKYAGDNMQRTQDNIQWKTSLEGPLKGGER